MYNDNGLTYEAGAGRFNTSHTEVLKLMRELGLKDKIKPITNNQRTFVKDGKNVNYNNLVSDLLFRKVLGSRSKFTNAYLKSITLGELMNKIVGKEKTQDTINAFGYNSEFQVHNAYVALKIFEHDFNDKIQYYYLQDGLSQIITLLHKKLIELGANIHFNTIVHHYDPLQNIIEYTSPLHKNIKKMHCNKVVFCVTHDTLFNFEDLVDYDTNLKNFLKGTQSAPLHRIFAQFPRDPKTGLAWFHGIARTTTNNPIRYIIPHNSQTGLMQISYTDNDFATYWHHMTKPERDKLLIKNLKLVFPSHKVSKPLWIESYYWKEGATYWKPNSVQYKNDREQNYYICGEMTSQLHCGWMEGSLRTVKEVLKLLT
jgi:protoporphyrinogen oxidase